MPQKNLTNFNFLRIIILPPEKALRPCRVVVCMRVSYFLDK